MEKIRQAFADKHFDEKSLQLISNFIQEFDDLFGQYVSRDEVIRRIKENLDVIEYDLKIKNYRGEYNGIKKEISLKESLDEENFKAVFFHEMIHCITRNQEKNVTGFSKTWDIDDFKEEKIVTCHGLTEGFTQYVTEIRNKKYAPNLNNIVYPILSEQTGNLVELLGEKRFLDIAFNRPDDLIEEMGFEAQGLYYDFDEFLDAFDTIWANEEEIYRKKNRTPDERLLDAIFGIDDEREDENDIVTEAKKVITDNLTKILMSKPITTVKKFNFVYEKICTYAEQLDYEPQATNFMGLLEQVNNLKKSGQSMEEILDEMPIGIRGLVKLNEISKDFENTDKDECIELLTQKEFLDKLYDDDIRYSEFKEFFLGRMAGNIMWCGSIERNYELFKQLTGGLAQIIKDRDYNVETLAIEYIEFENFYGKKVFNLYSTSLENSVYLGTFMQDEGMFLEMSLCDEKQIEGMAKKGIVTDGIIFTNKSGDILIYNGEEDYRMITWNGKILKNSTITYHQSELEILQDRLKRRIEHMERLKKMNAPQILMRSTKEGIQKAIERINMIQNKSKILPEEIEEATGDVSLEEIEAIMTNMTNSKEKRQEALERGIGYGEK